ncbi:MAG: hypothetical protein NTX73_03915 [Rhodobacterales bacterium]|nr:hypothetical protein [Rhodobacterales bacterium]
MRYAPLLAALALAAPAHAEGYIAIAPVFSQIVTMPVPDGFVAAYEDSNGDSYINEAIMEGDTLEQWRQMITLTGIRAMAEGEPDQVAFNFAKFLAGNYQGACPETFSANSLNAPDVRGAEAVFAGFLGCGDNGFGQSEAMSFLILVGSSDVYSLQWAERGPMTGPPVYDSALWGPRLAELTASARVCDRLEGEEAPCPSCIND